MDEQHIYHHQTPDEPRINLTVDKNTKGFNYGVTVLGAKSPDQALAILSESMDKLNVKLNEISRMESELGKP